MGAFINDSVGFTAQLPKDRPRIIKTHLPVEMLPPKLTEKARVIFLARNPKDSCVSWFKHEKLMPTHSLAGSFADLARLYIKGEVLFGNYWAHLNVS